MTRRCERTPVRSGWERMRSPGEAPGISQAAGSSGGLKLNQNKKRRVSQC
jgi:hypothetical protein